MPLNAFMDLWELRFKDGRGASFYTTVDLTSHLGETGMRITIPVARLVFEESRLADARRCFEEGRVLELTTDTGSIAYALRHTINPGEQ